jgi:predicted XRE-type DNA-binding protein
MSRRKSIVAKNSRDLAEALRISSSDRAALEVQVELTERIALEVRTMGITHADLAQLASTSRPRVTAILNGNLEGVSTDLLLRILAALGVKVQLKFRRAA